MLPITINVKIGIGDVITSNSTMKKRLVTIGCSFTKYDWPSWSDWMSTGYDEFYNFGSGGCGNRYMFNTFMDAHSRGLIDKETDVVIQWSSCVRDDRMDPHTTSWYGAGGVYFSDYYTQEYRDRFFNPYQMVFETINYIKAIRLILDIKQINYAMFFMLNPWDGNFLGEPWDEQMVNIITRKDFIQIKRLYKDLKLAVDGNFIDESLTFFQLDYQKDRYYAWQPNPNEPPPMDGHPGPKTHLEYLKKNILPYFPTTVLPDLSNSLLEWEAWAKLNIGTQYKKDRRPAFPTYNLTKHLGL